MSRHPTRRDLLLGLAGSVVLDVSAARQRIDEALFGSPVELLLPRQAPAPAIDAVLGGLRRLHRDWNAWKPGELTSLNAALREGRVASASPLLAQVLRGAAQLERLSLGHFNPAIGGLVAAWGFHDDRLRDGPRPAAEALSHWTTARPSLQQLEQHGLQLRSTNPALQIDLGACGKGVALEWALDRLQREGVGDALLNLGGNLAAMGHAGGSAGRPWIVGIRDPWGPGLVASLATQGREAVVTSGTYERWRRAGDECVAHVINPASGEPAAGLVNVTVVHADAALADAASTALLVAGPGRWRAVAQRMGVREAMAIDGQGRIEVTPSLQRRLLPPAA